MTKNRFLIFITLSVVSQCLVTGTAFAGFGFGDDLGRSGLDFNKGYDVNTVTTVAGQVVSPPWLNEKEHVFVDVKSGREIISLSLGPQSAWEKKEIPLHPHDDVIAKGSRAQGKDGKNYLMVQKLINSTTGAQMKVRNEHGGPFWSGRTGSGNMSNGPGGGMMRGGGGMMRH